MVNLIVNEIVETLKADLGFVDRITGLVKAAQVSDAEGNVKTLPIAYNKDVCVCSQSELFDLCPDSTKVSIIYFEDKGTTVTACENNSIYFNSSFTLVCWFNFKKIGCQTDTSLIAANILKYLPGSMGNVGNCLAVFLNVQGQQANDGGVFSKYSYVEEISQYITYPYGYVALDLSADFHVRKSCVEDLTACEAACL